MNWTFYKDTFFKKQYWSSGFDKKLWIFWWNINGWRKSVFIWFSSLLSLPENPLFSTLFDFIRFYSTLYRPPRLLFPLLSFAILLNSARIKLSHPSKDLKNRMRPEKWANKSTLPAPNAGTTPTKQAKSVPQAVFSVNSWMSRTRNLPMSPANAASTPNSTRPTAACWGIFSIFLHQDKPIYEFFGENYLHLPFFFFSIAY